MSAGKITMGAVLVAAGIVLLLNNYGVLSWDVWWSLASLWPVILIAAGIGMLFKGSRLALLGPLVLVVALAYAILVPGRAPHPWMEWSFGERARESREAVFSQLPRVGDKLLEMSVDFGAGELKVDGGSRKLYDAALGYRSVRAPREKVSRSGGVVRARLYQVGPTAGPQTWAINLCSEPRVRLAVNAGACRAELDLREVDLASLKVDCGASSVDVSLGGPSGRVPIDLAAGASGMVVAVPPGTPLRVKVDSALSTSNVGSLDLREEGGFMVTPSYSGATSFYDIGVRNGVGSFELRFADSPLDGDAPASSQGV